MTDLLDAVPQQLAQAGHLLPIGQVESLSGSVLVVHADGGRSTLSEGDPIHLDDRIETGPDGLVGLAMLDGGSLSLGGDGVVVLDAFVYDPATGEGESSLSMLQGVFSFASGAIAKNGPDASTITTPVGTIGIRGTTGPGMAGPPGTPNGVGLVPDADGTLGEIVWTGPGGTVTLNQENQFLETLDGLDLTGLTVLSAGEMASRFGGPLGALPDPAAVRFQFQRSPSEEEPDAGGDQEGRDESGAGEDETDQASDAVNDAAAQAARAALDAGATAQDALEAALDAVVTQALSEGLSGLEAQTLAETMREMILAAIEDGMSAEDAVILLIAGGGMSPTQFHALIQSGGWHPEPLTDLPRGGEDDNPFGSRFDYLEWVGRDAQSETPFGPYQTVTPGQRPSSFEPVLGQETDDTVLDTTGGTTTTTTTTGTSTTVEEEDEEEDGTSAVSSFVFTSDNDTVQGDAGDSTFIFDQTSDGGTTVAAANGGAFGGTDSITDLGGSGDRLTFQNLDNVLIKLDASGSGARARIFDATSISTVKASLTEASYLTYLKATVTFTGDVETVQAFDGAASGTAGFVGGGDLTGTGVAYVLAGSSASDGLYLDDANSVGAAVFGKAGNDAIYVTSGGGTTTVDGGAGTDILNYSLRSTDGVLGDLTSTTSTFQRLTGSNTVQGTDKVSNVEVVVGSQAVDKLTLANGVSLNTLKGEGGNDRFSMHDGASVTAIDGGSGTDTLFVQGTASVSSISNVENIVMTGTSGNDVLTATTTVGGSSHYNYVWGREGVDTIILETGASPSQVFGVLYSTEDMDGNADTIYNYSPANDKLVFDASLLTSTAKLDVGTYSGPSPADVGVLIYTTDITNPNIASNVATDLNAAFGSFTAGSKSIFVVTDSANSYVWYFQDDNNDGTIDAASELTQVAKLFGLDTASLDGTDIEISNDAALFEFEDTYLTA